MSVDFSHVIVGAGAVGLAIGARLARAGHTCLILDKNSEVGSETSSRNSEVIHAGLYYPPTSLKSKLCLRGKDLIYETKELEPFRKKCGKWLVAQTPKEAEYFEKLLKMTEQTKVPLEFISLNKARELEPAVIAREAVLNSPTTGIISSHALMQYFESQFETDKGSTDLALATEVKAIEKNGHHFELHCNSLGEEMVVKAAHVVNAAGLWAPQVSAMVGLNNYTVYYAKGNYFSYPSSQPRVQRLIYPCPSDQGSLGTHLTIDLAGGIKFGPDFEWVDSPGDYKVNSANLERAKQAISRYVNIDLNKLTPDYSGIRPKLTKDTSQFTDFHIAEDLPGFINLLGIESPGLTSSMAIAEHVEKLCT